MSKFGLSPIDEVHLNRAPLAKVLMQVQFSRTPILVSDMGENLMAEALGRYPVRRRQVVNAPALVINGQPMPMPQMQPASALTFSEPTGTWQVTLTDTAVALETTAYATRDDFCDRALELFTAVASVALPPVVDRVGLRYIDRLSGPALARVPDYVVPQLQVLIGSVEPGLIVHHSVTDSLIEISPVDRLQIRSGLLSPNAGFDPALPALTEASWVLDMDVFTIQAGFPFDPNELAARLRSYAETAYAFFRFATTDVFEADHVGDTATTAKDFR
jgi:uncharacterized protein (TIGR04255 family)